MEQNNKKSKLVFDMKIVRKLLKKNPTIKEQYCRYCGRLLSEKCDCVQPFTIIDVKPLRDNPSATIAIFADTPEFQKALSEVTEDFKNKNKTLEKSEN